MFGKRQRADRARSRLSRHARFRIVPHPTEIRRSLPGRNRRNDAGCDEPLWAVEPHEAVRGQPVEQVDAIGYEAAARDELGRIRRDEVECAHKRVPVISWAAPKPMLRWLTSTNPAAPTVASNSVVGGRYDVDAGR